MTEEDKIIADIERSLKEQEFALNLENVFAPQWCPCDPICSEIDKLMAWSNANLFAPNAFPTANWAFEKSVEFLLGILHGTSGMFGQITSGSTEGLFIALQAAREYYQRSDIHLIAPDTAHLSVKKLTTYGGIPKDNLHFVEVEENLVPSLVQLSDLISKHSPNMVICTAGTTDFGTVDPIADIAQLCAAGSSWLHVDAAYGGLYLPFLNHVNKKTVFDFALDAVMSITVDLHKTAGAPIPCSFVLGRNAAIFEKLGIEDAYTSALGSRKALTGSFPGKSAIYAYAILTKYGASGFSNTVEHCENLKTRLKSALSQIDGIEIFPNGHLPHVSFAVNCAAQDIAAELLRRGVYVETTRRLFGKQIEWIRAGISPHNTENSIDYLADFVRQILKA